MADITLGDLAFKSKPTGNSIVTALAGEAIDIGELVYLDSTVNKHKVADTTSAVKSDVVGIAITKAGADGDYFLILRLSVELDLGATLTVGQDYVLSPNTAGAIAPSSDLGTGDFVTSIGYASAADTLIFKIQTLGVAHP